MKTIIVRCLLSFSIACSGMTLANDASAVSSDYRIVGLAMHQETGRNIYLGAIHLGKDVPNPDNFSAAAPPRLMEYRIIARRTSIRSLLGKMLLQSEVANGKPPGPEVAAFADSLLSAVEGSLYSGDSFEILQDADRQITASLNGTVLVNSEDAGVFDYLLMGWLGERGPSTTFRDSIMRIDVHSSLLFAYEAHSPSAERIALVTQWAAPPSSAEPEAAPATSTVATVDEELVDEKEAASVAVEVEVEVEVATLESDSTVGAMTAAVSAIATTTVPPLNTEGKAGAAAEVAAEAPENVQEVETASEIAAAESTAETVVAPVADEVPFAAEPASSEPLETDILAMLPPAAAEDPSLTPADDIQSLDITEYSYRLAGFNTALIKLVYSEITYPRRAIRREIQGALELDITMLEDGSLVEVAIAESSGYSILDGAAVKAAEKALANTTFGVIDPVAVAEYGSDGNIVIPVPVNFILQ